MNILRSLLIPILFTLSGGCVVQAPTAEYPDAGMDAEVRAAVISYGYRIVVDCDGDGDPDSYGSMSAVGPKDFLTAGHMACDVHSNENAKYWGLDAAGNRRDVTLALVSATVDAALFKLADGFALNETWAEIGYEDPLPGDTVYQFTGGARLQMFFKVGYIGRVDDRQLWVSQHGVPGNSGSGVFNTQGEMIGVLWGGEWDPSKEFFFLATRPEKILDLISAIDS